MKNCPNCMAPVQSDYMFCAQCGSDLRIPRCPSCKKELPENAVFCPYCGNRLPTAAPVEKATGSASSSAYVLSDSKTASVPDKVSGEAFGQAKTAPVGLLSDFLDRDSPLAKKEAEPLCKNESDAAMLQELGDMFFRDCGRVMIDQTGNTPALRLTAISRIGQFLENLGYTEYRFAAYCTCYKPDYLSYLTMRGHDSCYDGGCGGYSSYSCYYELNRISQEEFDARKEEYIKAKEKGSTRALFEPGWLLNQYYIPYADKTEAFYIDGILYLRDPLEISGYFKIEQKYECV